METNGRELGWAYMDSAPPAMYVFNWRVHVAQKFTFALAIENDIKHWLANWGQRGLVMLRMNHQSNSMLRLSLRRLENWFRSHSKHCEREAPWCWVGFI